MKYIPTVIVLLCSCHLAPDTHFPPNGEPDTAFTKQTANAALTKLRQSITDSGFAVMIDANIQIQTVEFVLQKADGSRVQNGVADSLIVNNANGQLLYSTMMKAYQLALQHATQRHDITYYNMQLVFSEQAWLQSKFGSKKTYEALMSVFLLQKDMAVISMIVNNMDNESERNIVEEQYRKLNVSMEKNYNPTK